MISSVKKDKILEVATSLFSEFGYRAVGIDRIIADSNSAKMTLYKYFPSKDILIENVLLQRDEQLRVSIMAAISKKKSSIAKLKAIFEWYDTWFKCPDFHGCMFIKISEEYPDMSLPMKIVAQKHKLWLINLLRTLLEDMQINAAGELALHIMATLDGLTVMANMFNKPNDKQVKLAWKYTEKLLMTA